MGSGVACSTVNGNARALKQRNKQQVDFHAFFLCLAVNSVSAVKSREEVRNPEANFESQFSRSRFASGFISVYENLIIPILFH